MIQPVCCPICGTTRGIVHNLGGLREVGYNVKPCVGCVMKMQAEYLSHEN